MELIKIQNIQLYADIKVPAILKQGDIYLTCVHFDNENEKLIYCTSTGNIYLCKKKNSLSSHKFFDKDTLLVTEKIESSNNHKVFKKYCSSFLCQKGFIKCLIMEKIENRYYLFTGSADRTIKVWFLDPKGGCIFVQTLISHNATVYHIYYCDTMKTLFTVSSDKTLVVWKINQNTKDLFYHPQFCVSEVIQFDASMLSQKTTYGKKEENKSMFFSFIYGKFAEKLDLYVGDSGGNIHLFKSASNWLEEETKLQIAYDKSILDAHRLGIIDFIVLQKENTIYSIGYDKNLVCLDSNSGNEFYCFSNPNKTFFTCMDWDPIAQEILLGDELGYLYCVQPNQGKNAFTERVCKYKIIRIQVLEKKNSVLINTYFHIILYKINRGTSAHRILQGHEEMIISMIAIDNDKNQSIAKKVPVLISAAMDNSIRVWSLEDMSVHEIINCEKEGEIMCLHYVKELEMCISGHVNGDINFWRAELGIKLYEIQAKTYQSKNKLEKGSICVINSCCLSSSVCLMAAGYDGKIYVWEIIETKSHKNASLAPQMKASFYPNPHTPVDGFGFEILALICDESKKRVIFGGNESIIYIYNLVDPKSKQIAPEYQLMLEAHTDSITSLQIYENFLFSSSDDKTVIIWDLTNYYQVAKLENHFAPVKQVRVIKENGYFLTVTSSGEIFVWNHLFKLIHKLNKGQEVTCLDYLDDIACIIVGCMDASIFLIPYQDVFKNAFSSEGFQTNESGTHLQKSISNEELDIEL